jgi:ribosomal protein S12 methylthiotransferase
MNRKGCAESYARLIGTLRDKVPAAILRTTFLVGFPGETAEDFADLLDFQNEIRPSWAGVFTYSREESTPAYSLKPTVNKKTAEARKKILEERQTVITEAWLNGFIGTETDVLIEERVKEEDLALGRAWFQAPEVDGLVVVRGVVQADRKKVRARIQARSGVDLSAVLIDG